jgi:predicted aminopeptidase
MKTGHYKHFGESKLNNAVLLSYRTYYQDLSVFEKAFEKTNRNWSDFFNFFKKLKKSNDPEKDLNSFIGIP